MVYRTAKRKKIKTLIKFLGAGSGLLILSMLNPTLPHQLLKLYLRKKRFQRSIFLRDLRRLQARELLDFTESPDGLLKIVLKRRGQALALTYKLEDLSIKKPKYWDRTWRLVMFDIPHAQKKVRDAFRHKLQEMGFYQLQKSVFITPYPCENEIDFLCEVFKIRKYTLLIPTNDFEGAEKLKHYFRLL